MEIYRPEQGASLQEGELLKHDITVNGLPSVRIPRGITLTGETCTGSTTLTESLVKIYRMKLGAIEQIKKLGKNEYTAFHVGEIIRQWCSENRSRWIDAGPIIRRSIVEDQEEVLRSGGQFILESRMSGYLAREEEDVLRILCIADVNTRLQRYASRQSEISPQEVISKMRARTVQNDTMARLDLQVGNEQLYNPAIYNLVVNTTSKNPDQLAAAIFYIATARKELPPSISSSK